MRKIVLLAVLSALTLPLFAGPPAGAPLPEGPAEHQGTRKLISEDAEGNLLLHSRDVTVHGSTVRYEPKPEKNTIGFWSKPEDWVSWQFDLGKPGKFELEVMQGCVGGGSEVEVSVGDQKVRFTVEHTGGFQKFVVLKPGKMTLPAGRHTLSVRPENKKGVAVMDLRQIVLRRVQE